MLWLLFQVDEFSTTVSNGRALNMCVYRVSKMLFTYLPTIMRLYSFLTAPIKYVPTHLYYQLNILTCHNPFYFWISMLAAKRMATTLHIPWQQPTEALHVLDSMSNKCRSLLLDVTQSYWLISCIIYLSTLPNISCAYVRFSRMIIHMLVCGHAVELGHV